MSRADEVIDRVDTLGTVPGSIAQVFSLINDPKASPSDFERVVRPDPALTANLLRCANSAFYRGSREISSVRDAIARMGLRRVFEIAAGATFARSIPRLLEGYELSSDDYWAHSVATAVLSDRLGREAGFTYPDLAFTSGLLHDLGKLVVSRWLTEHPSLRIARPLTLDDELDLVGATHAELAEALCLRWHLPRDIAAAARWHHAPADAPTATLRYLASVIRLADLAAHTARPAGPTPPEPLDPECLERLGLEASRVEHLASSALPEIERTLEMLAQTRSAA
ncbi:MAG: HDOD domain-containing protein [Myxococcaceae bacterium]